MQRLRYTDSQRESTVKHPVKLVKHPLSQVSPWVKLPRDPRNTPRNIARQPRDSRESSAKPRNESVAPRSLARETSSDKVFQAGRQRLKPSSGILITRPTCRTDLVYHRDHLKYVMGERAGHWNDVRATYGYAAPVTSSHRRRREVLRLPSGERLVRTRVWSGVGSPPAKVRANSPR